MMTLDEYKQKAKEIDDWAPGWNAIDSCLQKLYGSQEPRHFGTSVHARAIFGGDEYLDGYSVFHSEHGYLHGITYGMSELYVNEESFGGEYSKWGYEMTIKLPLCTEEEYGWMLNMFSNLARYTFTSKRFFEPFQYISSQGKPIREGSNSRLSGGLLIVQDTEMEGIDTVHGRLDFLQMVGITQPELDAIVSDRENVFVLLENMRKDNPYLVTDLNRTIDYL